MNEFQRIKEDGFSPSPEDIAAVIVGLLADEEILALGADDGGDVDGLKMAHQLTAGAEMGKR